MEVYVKDMLVKSLHVEDYLTHLAKMYDILHVYEMKLNLSKCAFEMSSGKFLGFMVNQWRIEASLDKIRAVLEMKAPQIVREVQQLTKRIATFNHFMSKVIDKCLPFFKILRKVSKFEWTFECEEAFVRLKEYLSQPSLLSKS